MCDSMCDSRMDSPEAEPSIQLTNVRHYDPRSYLCSGYVPPKATLYPRAWIGNIQQSGKPPVGTLLEWIRVETNALKIYLISAPVGAWSDNMTRAPGIHTSRWMWSWRENNGAYAVSHPGIDNDSIRWDYHDCPPVVGEGTPILPPNGGGITINAQLPPGTLHSTGANALVFCASDPGTYLYYTFRYTRFLVTPVAEEEETNGEQ